MVAKLSRRDRIKSQARTLGEVGAGTTFDVQLAVAQAFGARRRAASSVSGKIAILLLHEAGHVRDIIVGRDTRCSRAIRQCVDRRGGLNSMMCTRACREREQRQGGKLDDCCRHLSVDYARIRYLGLSVTIYGDGAWATTAQPWKGSRPPNVSGFSCAGRANARAASVCKTELGSPARPVLAFSRRHASVAPWTR
jgi:hypothetical protein